jgi:hypothetical protein
VPRKSSNAKVILANPDVRRWYENVARGSQATAEISIRRLAAFCDATKMEPMGLVELPDRKLHDLFLDFVSAEEKRGKAGSYILKSTTAVRSWLRHNGVVITRPIKVRSAQLTPRIASEQTPTQEELRKVLLSADPKTRVACALIAFSGVRPEVLGNFLGDDGLRLRDLPELRIRPEGVEFQTIPTIVRVRAELSKTRRPYATFLGSEGCEYVRSYLEERIRQGEKLDPESDLVSPMRSTKAFVRALNIGDAIRKAIRAAGFPWRPYVLRCYFDTQLMLAESRGKIPRDYRVFFMGHVGGMDSRYTTNKGRLPDSVIRDMREAYQRAELFLSTTPRSDAADPTTISKTLLMGFGYSEEELAEVDLKDLALVQELVAKKMGLRAEAQSRQKLVSENDLPRYLEEGWKVVTSLASNQVVLDPPAFGMASRAAPRVEPDNQVLGP